MPVLDYTVTRPPVANAAALTSVDATNIANGVTCYVISLNAYFRYDNGSFATPDDLTVIEAVPNGRWLLSRPSFSTTGVLLGRNSAGGGVGEEIPFSVIANEVGLSSACLCATTGNLDATYNNGTDGVGATLTKAGAFSAFSADDVSPSLNDRVLVNFQTDKTQNGIYTVTTLGDGATAWVLTRATDYDTPEEIVPGDLLVVREGTLYGNRIWVQKNVVTDIGTSDIEFERTAENLVTSSPLDITGNTLSFENTVTSNQVLLSGAGVQPSWSTATYPATTTINQLLYSSAANTLSGLATSNNGVLVTSAGGVPSISSTLPTAVQSNITTLGTLASVTITGGTINGTVIGGSTPAAGTFTSLAGTSGSIANAQNAVTNFFVQNTQVGTGASAAVGSISDTVSTYLYSLSSGYTTTGRFVASGSVLSAQGAGGLSIAASNAAGVMRFYTNANNERMRILSTGEIGIGASTAPVGSLNITKASGAGTYTNANNYIHLGGGETLSGTNAGIGFGYTPGVTYSRGWFGWIAESDSGNTLGRFGLAQSATTADVAPVEYWSWDRSGNHKVLNTASVPTTPSNAYISYSSGGEPKFLCSNGKTKSLPDIYMCDVSSTGVVTTTNFNPAFATAFNCSRPATGQYIFTLPSGTFAYSNYFVDVIVQENLAAFHRISNQDNTGFYINFIDKDGLAVNATFKVKVTV